MIYTIDGSITYNTDDCTLSHLPTQESLSLSISTGRLFERLLTSEGAILSRDTLLTDVWDKYGLRGSNSNLNQYLSILRRALAAYGCENLIITIPKVGIRLNTDIPVERSSSFSEPVSDEAPDMTASPHVEPTAPFSAPAAPDRSPKNKNGFTLLAVGICLLGALVGGYLAVHKGEAETQPDTLTLTGGCRALVLQGVDSAERKTLTSQIEQMLRENQQTCDASRRIYFDRNTAFTTQNYGRTILSSCKLNSDGHVIACDNFYYLDWRME
jgi:DNA-binding winged helix-turn-helix (wHTH) protein